MKKIFPEWITRYYKGQVAKYLAFAFLFALIGGASAYYLGGKYLIRDNSATQTEVLGTEAEQKIVPTQKTKPELTIPTKKVLNVPYTVQAPHRRWDIHDESCEEAAALMYHYFLTPKYRNMVTIDLDIADKEIRAMKSWQVKNYGKEPDLSIIALGKFNKSYYGHSYTVFDKIGIADIKREIAKGNPVIVPVMTHSLENPNYGPENSYHVLMIKGYDKGGVITNDAGITQGRNRYYSWKVLFGAIDAQESKMHQGRIMLIVR